MKRYTIIVAENKTEFHSVVFSPNGHPFAVIGRTVMTAPSGSGGPWPSGAIYGRKITLVPLELCEEE